MSRSPMKSSHEGFPTERDTQIFSHTIPAKNLSTPDPAVGNHRQVDSLVRHTCKKMCSPHVQNRQSTVKREKNE